jgi:transcriptional regulator with XRE-family HTH domain
MEGFGSYLRGAREARKISLREISRVTRISRTILEALESDCRELLLPEVVVKGFIEAYARYCGLNPKEALARYAKWQAKNVVEKKKAVRSDKQGVPLRYIFAGAAGVTIVIIAALISLPGRTPQQGVQDVALAKGVPGHKKMIVSKTEQTTPVPTVLTQTTALPSSPDESRGTQAQEQARSSPVHEHTLVIKALERTWIQIKDGSSLPFDVILSRGESYTRKSLHPLTIVIGNAGTVTATFDGKGLGVLGRGGEVVKLTLPSP